MKAVGDAFVDASDYPPEQISGDGRVDIKGAAYSQSESGIDLVYKSDRRRSTGTRSYANVTASFGVESKQSEGRLHVTLLPPEYIESVSNVTAMAVVEPIVTHEEALDEIDRVLSSIDPKVARDVRLDDEVDVPYSPDSVEASLNRAFGDVEGIPPRYRDGDHRINDGYVVNREDPRVYMSIDVEPFRDGAKAIYTLLSTYKIRQDGSFYPDEEYFSDVQERIESVIRQE